MSIAVISAARKKVSVFDPISIPWAYYNNNIIDFDGTPEKVVDSGIFNAYARENFWHIWFASTIPDGVPAATRTFWGAVTSATATRINNRIQTSGAARDASGNIGRISVNMFPNQAIGRTVFHFYRDNVAINLEVNGVDWPLSNRTNLTKPTAQNTRSILYGADNVDGVLSAPWLGLADWFSAWGGSANLTAEQITNMNNWIMN